MYGGDRMRPGTGEAERGSRRAVGLPPEGHGEAAAPATARPPVARATTARHPADFSPLGSARPALTLTPRPSGWRAEGARP